MSDYEVLDGYEEGGDLGAVCAYYISPSKRHYMRLGEWTNYECPGCPNTGFVADYESGTAHCDEEECELYEPRDALGMIAFFEQLDARTDTRAINRKRREILDVVAQERDQRDQERESERQERLRRQQREQRQAEAQRQAAPEAQQNQAQQSAGQQGSSEQQSQQEMRNLEARGEELFGSRQDLEEAVEEKRRQRQKEDELQKKERDRQSRQKADEQHHLLQQRAVRAGVRITAGELFLAAVLCAVVAFAFHYGVGYLEDFSHYARGYYAIGTEEARVAAEEGWLMGSVRAVVDFMVPDVVADWRRWIGVSLGAVVGVALWAKGSGKRREQAAFADHEGLIVRQYDRKVRNW